MFAIFVTGGKLYKVSEGDVIFVEKLGVAEGEKVTFDSADESVAYIMGKLKEKHVI